MRQNDLISFINTTTPNIFRLYLRTRETIDVSSNRICFKNMNAAQLTAEKRKTDKRNTLKILHCVSF